MVFLAIGGCFAFESPIDGDPGEGGFGSPTISRCRIMFRVTVETDVSWAESSMARTVNPLGSELDVFEIVQIDLGETGIEASYDASTRRFTVWWDHGSYDETFLELVVNDLGTAISSLTLERTASEDVDLYRLTRRWEVEIGDLCVCGWQCRSRRMVPRTRGTDVRGVRSGIHGDGADVILLVR